jgi:desampylase
MNAAAVSISAALLRALLTAAAAIPEREICGLLFGTDRSIDRAQHATNVAADPTHWFEIDPTVLIAAHRAERAGGARLVGHYHSHPSGSAEPSARDLAAAEPGRLWLILGGDEARLWRAEATAFSEVKLIVA